MRNFFSRAFVIAGLMAMAACGGGGEGSKFENPPAPAGGGGGSAPPPAAAAQVTVTSSVPSISSAGGDTAEIVAMVRDATNNLISGVPITFSASSGGVAVSQAITDGTGQAKASLVTAGDSTLRTIVVTASAGSGLSATVNVQVVAGGGGSTASVQMGSGTGTAFQPGVISIANANVSAGGSTNLQVVLQQTDGTLYAQPATVTFSSVCVAQGLASVGQPVQTSTGIVTASYAASGCSGADQLTATATVGGQALSATGTVTVAPASIGSIVYESATPTSIALKGTGNTARPESSTVVFRVLDSTGGPRAGATVNFTLNTSVGGLSLQPSSGTTGPDGRVQTTVQAGTVASTVRVTATVTNVTPNIGTQSSQLTVTTGIPDQDSFSLAVQCPNVEAWRTDGRQVAVTARLADRFNNPVPDGTAVTFTTEGGRIQSQCTTISNATESGFCAVTWTSSDPRPVALGASNAGRSTLLATAIGEESFTDANGNGVFDASDLTFVDLGERFLDADESGTYDLGELIYDFNNNSTRDPADNVFNGVLCNDPARCDANATTTGIASSNLIIMSDGVPVPDPLPGPLGSVGGANGSNSFFIEFKDLNGNPLPQGTTIAGTIAGTGFSLAAPSSYTVPCTTGTTTYPFTVTTSATPGSSAVLTITVTSPGGLVTTLTYGISP